MPAMRVMCNGSRYQFPVPVGPLFWLPVLAQTPGALQSARSPTRPESCGGGMPPTNLYTNDMHGEPLKR